MATVYYKSTAAGLADGTSWTDAYTTLTAALAGAGAGGIIYVSSASAETISANATYNSPGTASQPVRMICVAEATPPTTLATTATHTNTGANTTFFGSGYIYVYGILFVSGSATSSGKFATASGGMWSFEKCGFKLGGSSSTANIIFGVSHATHSDQYFKLHNCTFQFTNVAQFIGIRCRWDWTGSQSSILGSTFPTYLFSGSSGGECDANIVGVDLSALSTGKSLVSISSAVNSRFTFTNCKLSSDVSLVANTPPSPAGMVVKIINSDNDDALMCQYQVESYRGSITQSTSTKRTGGATNGTTAYSLKMVSAAEVTFLTPLTSDPIDYWNNTTGSPITINIPVITDAVTLKESEAWVEIEYLGTSGNPLGLLVTDSESNLLTAHISPSSSAAQTTDTDSTWTTDIASPTKQKLSVTFTPQEKGLIRARVFLARASTTMYFDPKVLSTASKTYLTDSGFVSEGAGASESAYISLS